MILIQTKSKCSIIKKQVKKKKIHQNTSTRNIKMFLLNPYDFQPISGFLEVQILTLESLAVMPDPQRCWAHCQNWIPLSSKKTHPKQWRKCLNSAASEFVPSTPLLVTGCSPSLARAKQGLTDGVSFSRGLLGSVCSHRSQQHLGCFRAKLKTHW